MCTQDLQQLQNLVTSRSDSKFTCKSKCARSSPRREDEHVAGLVDDEIADILGAEACERLLLQRGDDFYLQ